MTASGLRYIDRADYEPEPEVKPVRTPRAPAPKIDPKHLAAARELRDRYLEEVNANPRLLEAQAKYEVARQLPDKTVRVEVVPVEPKQLPAAA